MKHKRLLLNPNAATHSNRLSDHTEVSCGCPQISKVGTVLIEKKNWAVVTVQMCDWGNGDSVAKDLN